MNTREQEFGHVKNQTESTPRPACEPRCPQCGNKDDVETINWWPHLMDPDDEVAYLDMVQQFYCPECEHSWFEPEPEPEPEPRPTTLGAVAILSVALMLALLILAAAIVIIYDVDVTLYEDFSFVLKAGPRWW